MLEQYKALLDRYHGVIWGEPNSVEREAKRLALVPAMDALWPKLTRRQQDEALAHAEDLYRRFRW